MAKTIYRREKLEPELGYVGAHNFLMQQAKEATMKKREELHGEYANHGLCDANYPTEKRNRASKLRKGASL